MKPQNNYSCKGFVKRVYLGPDLDGGGPEPRRGGRPHVRI